MKRQIATVPTVLLAALAVGSTLHAADFDPLVKPGRRMLVIDTPHLHALVPADAAEDLRARIVRADAIYVHLAADAGYTISEPLTLWLSDDAETHNGFSTTVPRPLVEIELAPSLPRSGVFTGGDEFERTLTHELTHHISNDRVYGFQAITSTIFGRVYPTDYLSLLTAYLTVPPHVTMPMFWHEGLAQWSETAYADPTSAWGGRGRDSLTHLVWRLDADADAIPQPDDWRATYSNWPFGNRVYLYGLAYTRYLDGAYGSRASLWRFMERQAHTWPFFFNRGTSGLLNVDHATLLAEARTALLSEQRASLATLRSVPTTELHRLTDDTVLASAPAWLPDGKLLTAIADPWGTSRIATVDREGHTSQTWSDAYDRGEIRGLPDGTTVYAESLGSSGDEWARSRVRIRHADGSHDTLDGERLLQPDLRASGTSGYQVVALHLLPGGHQEIALTRWYPGIVWGSNPEWATIPTQGRPWHPTFRPGYDELAWIETDHDGSRLVLASLADPTKRTVLATVHGRLIHPSWSADGSSLFVCADHSGVPNAYRIDVATPGALVPVTNVIGGITACVPSPDGKELAVVAFDRKGPFLARLANDPKTFPPRVPSITLAWPAPVAAGSATVKPGPALTPTPLPAKTAIAAGIPGAAPAAADGAAVVLPPAAGPIAAPGAVAPGAAAPLPEPHAYWGIRELRFLFWSPTTLVTPYGGIGVQALAADPLYTHQATAGIGFGEVEGTTVGSASYTWSPYAIGLSATAYRAELTYSDEVVDANGQVYDYTENDTTYELRAGYRLLGSERRIRANVALGVTNSHEVQSSVDRYAGQTIISTAPFIGQERYIETSVGYADNASYPTSYTKEDGPSLVATYRTSGLGGDLERKRLAVSGSYTWSIFPHLGHQIVAGGWVGWSDPEGSNTLQAAFTIGGTNNALSPRGYPDRIVSGFYSVGWSGAYRLPLWRPFDNFGTTPFGFRQVVLEPYFDAGQVSTDHVHGNGDWYRSAGGELALDWEVWALRLDPLVGIAKQIDGQKDTVGYFRLGFRW